MKIDSISIENFGVFKRKCFQFELAPLVLVYGANEAGKTTALNGIRQAIAGFRPRSGYLVGGSMRAEISAQLRSGKPLEICRRKSRTDLLSGTLDGHEIDAQKIQSLLSNVDIDSYEQLFGFTLDELRKGEAALKSVRLSDALAGGSMGGIRAFEQLRRDLDTSLGELYKSRGSTPHINLKLTELKEQQQKLRSEEVLPQKVESLRSAIKDAGKQAEKFKSEMDALRKRIGQLNRVQRAIPHFETRKAILSQLEDIDLPPELDSSFVSKWADYAEERKTLVSKIDSETERMGKGEASLKSLSADGELLRCESEVERLGHGAQEILAARGKVAELGEQIAESENRLRQLLEQINQSDVTTDIQEFSISLPEKSQLEEWSQHWKSMREQSLAVAAKIEATQEHLGESSYGDTNDEEFGGEVPGEELAALLVRWEESEKTAEQKAGVVETIQANTEYKRLTAEVAEGLRPGFLAQPDWQVPNQELTEKLGAELAETQQSVQMLLRKKEELAGKLEALTRQREFADKSEADKVLATLAQISQQRNALLEQWLDELSQPLIAASISVEQQQERLAELKRIGDATDSVQDELLGLADDLAEARQAKLELERIEEQLERTNHELADTSQRVQELEEHWDVTWQSIPIVIQDSASRLAWLDTFKRWARHCVTEQAAKRELHICRRATRDIENEVLDTWPVHVRQGTSRTALSKQLAEWKENARDRSSRIKRLEDSRKSVAKLESQLTALNESQKECESSLLNWLDGAPVDCAWPLDQIPQLVEILLGIKREVRDLERYRNACEQFESAAMEFEASIQELARELNYQGLESTDTVTVAKGWLDALHAVRSERSQRVRLTSEIDFSKRRLEEWARRLETIDSKLLSLCSRSGVEDVAEVSALLNLAAQAEDLRKRLSETNAALSSIWPEGEFDEAIGALGQCDPTAIQFELQECNGQLGAIEKSRKEADQLVGSLTQELEHISGSRSAQQASQRISLLRGELSELAEQWVVEKVGQVLLKKTIESFSKDHEPKLLSLTRTYLSQLTGGRYVDVKHDDSAKQSFVVFNSKGEAYETSQLSTGTREQLYLAIRMAFVIHHCEQHEPLPILMDDCFVNFDDDRARHAIEAVGEWDNSIQTVILSCHSRTLDIVRDAVPDAKIIMLSENPQPVSSLSPA